jgi:protein farnesyltransferase/geranylgeranyltransferase type-1 subunit alpha
MLSKECSPRCLKLTDHVISMNPAHYTVWLYRFKIIAELQLPFEDEITWLNEVALDNLKNYQIWHHRQLIMDHYFPEIEPDSEAAQKLARSETRFVTTMLAEDTKNYHVWSYRQYLVRKLGTWNLSELLSTQNLIENDVRNNSAWSHRFFLVFSDPKTSTPDSHSTEHDPAIPGSLIDREAAYAKEKILLAPQNQAAWNYLRGVLAKGGRKLSTEEEFVRGFVSGLGDEGGEKVTSTHALDALADLLAEKGEKDGADLVLRRLGEKWDPIRVGYWNYRRRLVASASAEVTT